VFKQLAPRHHAAAAAAAAAAATAADEMRATSVAHMLPEHLSPPKTHPPKTAFANISAPAITIILT